MTEIVAPYQDPSIDVDRRVEDLLSRMEPADKAGLMFHDMVVMGPGGTLAGSGNMIARPPTAEVIQTLRMNHLNLLGAVSSVRELVAWHNRVQEVARETALGIPVTLSTDPRYSFSSNPGTAARAGAFSAWPESLGFAALREPAMVEKFADVARQEYVAGGFRVALHPQIDLATEPHSSWSRRISVYNTGRVMRPSPTQSSTNGKGRTGSATPPGEVLGWLVKRLRKLFSARSENQHVRPSGVHLL